jgi:hypothetical protein
MSTNENIDVEGACDPAERIKITPGNGLVAMNESNPNLIVRDRH